MTCYKLGEEDTGVHDGESYRGYRIGSWQQMQGETGDRDTGRSLGCRLGEQEGVHGQEGDTGGEQAGK